MADAALAEVMRGGRIESRHGGAAVVTDAGGRVIHAAGDIEAAEFPRSAVKAILALPLVENGAADRLGLDDAELALSCASHTGEAHHVAVAASMLRKAGRTDACLECGAHWPTSRSAAQALAAAGRFPGPLHNNCSGKHAGFICAAVEAGDDPAGYVGPDHPTMRAATAALADLVGTVLDDRNRGIDGCGIPTYAIPLHALATGFARVGCGAGLSPDRARAAARLRAAVASDPFLVAGRNRYDTTIMTLLGARLFSKIGAEGIVAAAMPELGLGFAVKCRDGAARAAEVAMTALIAPYLAPEERAGAAFQALLNPVLTNWSGTRVGEIRPAAA
ncbi:asparaginase [Lichenicoccus sp.]|uniref:asparaginase n=1 Tax=Lichenicoccus sp. TaxID=2781899 RepID=UPI003D1379C1